MSSAGLAVQLLNPDSANFVTMRHPTWPFLRSNQQARHFAESLHALQQDSASLNFCSHLDLPGFFELTSQLGRSRSFAQWVVDTVHTPPVHTLLTQSLGSLHFFPTVHFVAQSMPPQSISVSLPLCLPSTHAVACKNRQGACHLLSKR